MVNLHNIQISTHNYNLIIDKSYVNILKCIKIINKYCIFLTGIPNEIKIEELIAYKYLGQYGKITNIIKSKQKKNLIKTTYSIYVTFSSKLDTAITIKSLNNFKFKNKIMKCSYASNKICIDYLFNLNCSSKDCYFYHGKIKKNNSILKILKNTNYKIIDFFQKINDSIIKSNINKIRKKFKKLSSKETTFPSVTNFITNFINNNIENYVSTDFSSKKIISNNLISFKKL